MEAKQAAPLSLLQVTSPESQQSAPTSLIFLFKICHLEILLRQHLLFSLVDLIADVSKVTSPTQDTDLQSNMNALPVCTVEVLASCHALVFMENKLIYVGVPLERIYTSDEKAVPKSDMVCPVNDFIAVVAHIYADVSLLEVVNSTNAD